MGTLEHYDVIIQQVDDLVEYLKSIEVEAELSSHLESDYLAAHEFPRSFAYERCCTYSMNLGIQNASPHSSTLKFLFEF